MSNAFTIPKFQLPGFVASLGQKLPQWPHVLALIAGLNVAKQMMLLPEDSLAELNDKLFNVRVRDTGGEASFTYRNGMFRPVFRSDREPDLAFSANLSVPRLSPFPAEGGGYAGRRVMGHRSGLRPRLARAPFRAAGAARS